MQDSLTQQRKARPAVHHPLDEFQFVDVSFDHSIVLRKCQSCDHCGFVSLNPCDKALQFANPSRSDLFEPVVKLFSCACAQHASKLLNQVVGQVDLWMKVSQREE